MMSDMKHPTAEELVSWVYGETSGRAKRELQVHVNECGECRAQVDLWRETGDALEDLPAPAARRGWTPVVAAPLRWAAAAALFVALGIVLGRFAFSTDEGKLRAALHVQMEEQIATAKVQISREFQYRQDESVRQIAAAAEAQMGSNNQKLVEEFTLALQQARVEDRANYLSALRELGAKHDAEVAALKKGIETVVALADYGFEATEQRFAQLAASTQTAATE
jgi:hypothetical protein